MRLSWRASTSALFRLTSFRRPFSPLATTAKLPPPTTTHLRPQRIRPSHAAPRRMASAAARAGAAANSKSWDETDPALFATHNIPKSTVFAASPLSFAFVNLRPVVPGHVLVSSKRFAPRFADLTPDEVSDLWLLAQKVGRVAELKQQRERQQGEGGEKETPPSALTFALQDGASAGQSVPHVHVHVIPRGGSGDRFLGEERNDELYPELQRAGAALSRELTEAEKERAAEAAAAAAAPAPDPFQRERRGRTLREMEEEAAALRELFSKS